MSSSIHHQNKNKNMASQKQLIIIYNANSSVRGKLTYAFNKLSKSGDEPECAACDITHGGLSLKEAPGWVTAKKEIESQGWKVIQWHRDEVEQDVKDWVKNQDKRYPIIVSRSGGEIEQVADSGDLGVCAGDATKLLGLLKEKNLVDSGEESSL